MRAQTLNGGAPARALDDDLAANAQALGAALQQIDALRIRHSLLEQDVARLEREVEKVRRFAHYDELTGLPNRRLLADRFNQAVAGGARRHKRVSLVLLDLDGFKGINDALGHAAGDDLLKQVAARLTACIRASDTACRYGGDEFVVLLPEFEGRRCVVAAAEKIRAHLARPYVIDGIGIKITTSIGMAVSPLDGEGYGELMQVSDLAMYRDKARSPAPPSVLGSEPVLIRTGAAAKAYNGRHLPA